MTVEAVALGGDVRAHADLEPLLCDIDALRPHERNPRAGDTEAIAESIKANGLYRPVYAQRSTGRILAGNHTYAAALELGATRLPVVWLDVDDEAAARILLVDNRAADLGRYDDALLIDLLNELGATEAGLFGTGYSYDDAAAIEAALRAAEHTPLEPSPSLADRFIVPPFTILDARSGAWQERKHRWLALGIRSEVGRGDDLLGYSQTVKDAVAGKLPRRGLGAVQTNLDGEDAERYGRKDTRPADTERRRRASSALEGTRLGGPPGSHALNTPQAGDGRGGLVDRTLAQGLTAHRDPVTGDLVYTETTAAGVSIFDPVLCELTYRWFCPPGGTVLDVFAGGSVRGIVAAALGHPYTGIELRPEQVEADGEQREHILPRLRPAPVVPADLPYDTLTPVEEYGGLHVKRDDLWACGGVTVGAKGRTMHRLLTAGRHAGLMTAGAAVSPQIERAALVAAALGVPCRVHTSAGNPTPSTEVCEAAGAEVVRHQPGRLTVLKKRLADDAADHPDWLAMPFGMDHHAYVTDVAAQCENIPDGARVVIPVGSGTTLAAVWTGLRSRGKTNPVLGVRVGGDPTGVLDRHAPGWGSDAALDLVASDLAYRAHAPVTDLAGLPLDPQYEAKCLPYCEPGDLLWLVGLRGAAATATRPPPAPRWVCGDARRAEELLPAGETYDLLFTCPPYHDLEVYSLDPADLSNMPWPEFLAAYRQVIAAAVNRLADDRFAVWVVGEIRDKSRGTYRNLVGETIRAFTDAGAAFYNEAILATAVGSLPIRAGRQFATGRKLGKTHQNVLVFCKGDWSAAAKACGVVEVEMPVPDDAELQPYADGATL